MIKRTWLCALIVLCGLLCVGCGDVTPTPSVAATQTGVATASLTGLADSLSQTHDALAKGDIAAAKTSYSAFNTGWYDVESSVRGASLDLYRQTEDAMAPVGFKLLRDDKPVAADILPLVAQLQAVYTKDIAAASAAPASTASTGQAIGGADVDAAVAKIRTYMLNGADALVTTTTVFAAAVKAHDLAAAQTAYIKARPNYEGIEFLAEAFPDADSAVDARANDFPQGEKDAGWTGFHALEKAIFADHVLDAHTDTLADTLVDDVTRLRNGIATLAIDPDVAINGAASLIEEIQATKITGEEERYSYTDLTDFKANLASARFIYDTFAPFVRQRNPTLATDVTGRFTTVEQAIAPFFDAQGKAVAYTQVNEPTRKELAQKVEALANAYSQVAGTLGLKG